MKTRPHRTNARRRLLVESLEGRRLLTASAPNPFDLSTLDGTSGFRVDGEAVDSDLGTIVSQAGDVNGDGFDDFIVGAVATEANAGGAYVVFGTSTAASEWNVQDLDGTNGFEIRDSSIPADLAYGYTVGAAGDVNGDGYDDVVVGDRDYDQRSEGAWVIYGSSDFEASFDVSSIDTEGGYRVLGTPLVDGVGLSVGGVGDINGDGYDDVGIDLLPSGQESYIVHVVFGQSDRQASTIVFGSPTDGEGVLIQGSRTSRARGFSAGGDVNGDGFDDILIDRQIDDTGTRSEVAPALVFGAAQFPTLTIRTNQMDGQNGFRIIPDSPFDRIRGADLSGDINGDGLNDIVISYPSDEGEARVIFGTSSGFPAELDLAALDGSNGFRVRGERLYTESGAGFAGAASFAGDINADGFDDIAFATFNSVGNLETTSSYVLFGKPSDYAPVIDVASFDGSNGFRIDSPGRDLNGIFPYEFFDSAGRSVSGAGDVNGDGFSDLLIGAQNAHATLDGQSFTLYTGAAYVVFGGDFGAVGEGVSATVTDGVLSVTGTDKADELRISMEGGEGIPGDPPINTGVVNVTIEGLGTSTVNGQAQLTFDSVSEVHIETGRGADTVVFAGPVSTEISLDTGRGRDFVEIQRGPEGRAIRPFDIDTDRGADHVLIRQLSDRASVMTINTGSGNDRVTFTDSEVMRAPGPIDMGDGDDVLVGSADRTNVDISRGLILGGEGIDTVVNPSYFFQEDASVGPAYAEFEETASGSFIGGEITTTVQVDPELGNVLVIKGNDNFDHDLHLTSSGQGQVSLASLGYGASIAGLTDFTGIDRVKVVLGSGRDSVFAEDLWLSDKLIINTGLGDDIVNVVGGKLDKLRINTGGGDDQVLVDGTTVLRRAKVTTGWGVDYLAIHASTFGRKAIFEGGLDDDTLDLLAGHTFNKGCDNDFENVLGG